MMALSERWDLESIFPGGSGSTQLKAWIAVVRTDLASCREAVLQLPEAPDDAWESAVRLYQDAAARLNEASSFVGCLQAQNTADAGATQIESDLAGLEATLSTVSVSLAARFRGLADPVWERFLKRPGMREIRFALDEMRLLAGRKMDQVRETLAEELAADGYHGWDRLYTKLAGSLRATVEQDGKRVEVSLGQLSNRLEDRDRSVRRDALAQLESAWRPVADLAAITLNNLAGFRLSLYRSRGWDSILEEPLRLNRLRPTSLDAMWEAVAAGARRATGYLQAKAKLLGLSKPSWFDVSAPVGAEPKYTYDQAAGYILERFSAQGPQLADFARMAFEERWIEVEDRPGKGAGGFCTDFPVRQQTRIFMTFGKTFGGVSTLAHELGHAHHAWVLRERALLATDVPMALAETASTFCETLITEAAVERATEPEARLGLLGRVLDRSVMMLMNLRCRFLFETDFYAARAEGALTAEDLNELMVRAQRTAFCDALADDGYHPLLWASKLHFYITDYPFYNFPYVFGFLFSNGVYARARAEGRAFLKRYEALLEDTGSMSCEDLAHKHLGVDLSGGEFWRQSVDQVLGRLDEFKTAAAAAR